MCNEYIIENTKKKKKIRYYEDVIAVIGQGGTNWSLIIVHKHSSRISICLFTLSFLAMFVACIEEL
jgi:hypothetical protein